MRNITILSLAFLLLTACGVRHETKSIDTALVLTEDSISFDVCFEVRMRNIMGVWVDSMGTLSLNHDWLNQAPPLPPGEDDYEYTDDRVPTELNHLRKQVRRFLANRESVPDLPEKQIENLPMIGEYPVSKGLVSILTIEGVPEATVDSVRHEIAAAVIELRDSLSLQLFGLHYGDLPTDQADAISAAIPTSTYDAKRNRFYQISDKKQ